MMGIFVAIWFAIFSIPTFIYLKDRKRDKWKEVSIGPLLDIPRIYLRGIKLTIVYLFIFCIFDVFKKDLR